MTKHNGVSIKVYPDRTTDITVDNIKLDDIDGLASEILDLLEGYEAPRDIASYALCRAIVAINYDLDKVCKVIDDMTSEDMPVLDYLSSDEKDEEYD